MTSSELITSALALFPNKFTFWLLRVRTLIHSFRWHSSTHNMEWSKSGFLYMHEEHYLSPKVKAWQLGLPLKTRIHSHYSLNSLLKNTSFKKIFNSSSNQKLIMGFPLSPVINLVLQLYQAFDNLRRFKIKIPWGKQPKGDGRPRESMMTHYIQNHCYKFWIH